MAPPTGPAINYRYDYAGNLVEKSEEEYRGERTRYVYGAGAEPLAQQEGGQWTDNVVVNGKIVETFRRAYGNNPNSKLFYHTDALGSVVALSNRAGRVARTTEYDPWGKVLTDNFATGPDVGGPVSVAYEFVGGYGVRRDVDNKSIMGVRMYDAGVGRFTTTDPLGFGAGDTNLYRYARNNPLLLIDPYGNKTFTLSFGIGGGVGYYLIGAGVIDARITACEGREVADYTIYMCGFGLALPSLNITSLQKEFEWHDSAKPWDFAGAGSLTSLNLEAGIGEAIYQIRIPNGPIVESRGAIGATETTAGSFNVGVYVVTTQWYLVK